MRRNGPAHETTAPQPANASPGAAASADADLVAGKRQLPERLVPPPDEPERHARATRLGQHQPTGEAGRAQHGEAGLVHDTILSNRLRCMSAVTFDVEAVRARFPALKQPLVFFDGPGGTQVPESVIEAIAGYLRASNANSGGDFARAAAPTR